jgi:hypothetical protein
MTSWSVEPAAGDIVTIGRYGVETGDYIVNAVYPSEDLTARIEFVDYNEAIYTSDTGAIPPYNPGITVGKPPALRVPPVPIINSVTSDETALVIDKDGSASPRILVDVSPGVGGNAATARLQAQYRTHDPAGIWYTVPQVDATLARITINDVLEDVDYDIRVRAVSPENRASGWSQVGPHRVIGGGTPPPDVEELLIGIDKRLTWQYPDPPRDFAGFRIKHQAGTDATWSTGIPLHDGLISETQFDAAFLPPGTRTVMVKAVDYSGNESVNAAVIVKDLGGPAVANVTDNYDMHGGGFVGTKTDCTVEGGTGDLVGDTENTVFWGADGSVFWATPDSALFWGSSWKEWSYVDSWTPNAAAIPGTIEVNIAVTAPSWKLEWKLSSDSTWKRWPGYVVCDAAVSYDFRLTVDAATIETRCTQLEFFIDVPDVVEYQNDVVVTTATPFRLTLTKSYRVIKQVLATVQDTGSGARKLVVLDKQATAGAGNGPSVQLWDDSNPPYRVQDKVDFRILGY